MDTRHQQNQNKGITFELPSHQVAQSNYQHNTTIDEIGEENVRVPEQISLGYVLKNIWSLLRGFENRQTLADFTGLLNLLLMVESLILGAFLSMVVSRDADYLAQFDEFFYQHALPSDLMGVQNQAPISNFFLWTSLLGLVLNCISFLIAVSVLIHISFSNIQDNTHDFRFWYKRHKFEHYLVVILFIIGTFILMFSIALPIMYSFPWYCVGETDIDQIIDSNGVWVSYPPDDKRCHHYAGYMFSWVGGLMLLVGGLGSFVFTGLKTTVVRLKIAAFTEIQQRRAPQLLKDCAAAAAASKSSPREGRHNEILRVLAISGMDDEDLVYAFEKQPDILMGEILSGLRPVEKVKIAAYLESYIELKNKKKEYQEQKENQQEQNAEKNNISEVPFVKKNDK